MSHHACTHNYTDTATAALSVGAIVGISVGVLVAVVCGCICFVSPFMRSKHENKSKSKGTNSSNQQVAVRTAPPAPRPSAPPLQNNVAVVRTVQTREIIVVNRTRLAAENCL